MSFRWLKRSMPRGLYGRAALILVLPVLSLQLIVSITFIQRHFEDVTRQMTRSVLIDMRYLLASVDAAPDAVGAREVARTLGPPLDLAVTMPADTVPPENARRFYDLSGRVVIATLAERLDGLLAVDLPNDRDGTLWVATDWGPMEVGFDRRRVSASNPHQLLVVMIVLGALLTGVAYVYLRNQLRPITRMAAAAEAFGKGRIAAYHPSGATEVRAAGHAFLEMRARIERQTQTRTMMLSGVSHDLRTPLTRLRLGLSLLDDPEAEPMIRDVDDMQRLLDTFLDFARGNAEDEVEPVDLVALVAGAVEDARRAGLAVDFGGTDGAGEAGRQVHLRPMSVRRALDNLIGNALRYGNRARVSLAGTERTLRIVVEDDGPGIAPADRDEAVRPFSRLDPARNQDRGGGVGLGLAIVADVARSHGGQLRLGDSADMGGLKAELVLAR